MILHWFRRDLRVEDNTSLDAARRDSGGDVLPVFVLSDWRGQHRWTGPARQEALCGSLRALADTLETLGSRLVLRRGDAVQELERILTETRAEALCFNRSPDPAGRALEAQVQAMAARLGVRIQSFHDVTVLKPEAVLTQTGQPFRVFTPYSRAWMKHATPSTLPRLGAFHRNPLLAKLPSHPLPSLADWGLTSSVRLPESGELAARRRMDAFFEGPVFHYATERDLPAVDATSHLSADLRWGTVSPRGLIQRCHTAIASAKTATLRESPRKFLGELIWREFYMAVLWHWPEVLEHEFQPRFRTLRWWQPGDSPRSHAPSPTEAFQRWCDGTTGFPIVDAGMRQLVATGWMHNRVRMIVSMFLTKDLHLDWRLGEAFFMQHLADGEIASNNGGWQWSAGVGADAAPYFRIQNPWTQTARYDPDGEYIKRWVPELENVFARALAKPPAPGAQLAPGYPPPIVDHAREREITLEMFRE